MPPQDKRFRRPDGTLYDPNKFTVRQYEEQYGPGGVPEGWSMAAVTPVQSPGTIIGLGIFLSLISVMMLVGGFIFIGSGQELRTILLAFAVGTGGIVMSIYSFRLAAKRRRWLKEQEENTVPNIEK